MIPLEGRILPGLDEFMLRLGHLKVLSGVADDVGASPRRIIAEMSRKLTSLHDIKEDHTHHVAEYLARKRLCIVAGDAVPEGGGEGLRYPDIVVELRNGQYAIHANGPGNQAIWWQDACLSAPEIRSKVGGITVSAKAGSKTGLSHIYDWAAALDLISNVGELSFSGKLLVRLPQIRPELNDPDDNPYLMGGERILLADILLREDFDVFARFVPRLLNAKTPIRKTQGRSLFAEVVDGIAEETERASYLPSNARYKLFEQAKELQKAAKRSRRDVNATSTAWHRASSRLETYVDLGLLEKARTGSHEKFEYNYYPTPSLERAAETLSRASTADDWFEKELVAVLVAGSQQNAELGRTEIVRLVSSVIQAMRSPTPVYAISVLAQGIAWQAANEGSPIALSTIRRGIEELARESPEIARLSRGRQGTRAEFVSVNLPNRQ